jgi:hypothetical protein
MGAGFGSIDFGFMAASEMTLGYIKYAGKEWDCTCVTAL